MTTCRRPVAMVVTTRTEFRVSALMTTVAVFDVLNTFAAYKHAYVKDAIPARPVYIKSNTISQTIYALSERITTITFL